MNEFLKMLGDPAHWAFEGTVTLVIDGLLVGIFWPLIRNCWQAWQVTRELGQRAEFTAQLWEDNLCNACGALPKRVDNSVDICTHCGGVQLPKKRSLLPTREQYEAEKAARVDRQQKCDHLHKGVNLLARDGVCSKCMVVDSARYQSV